MKNKLSPIAFRSAVSIFIIEKYAVYAAKVWIVIRHIDVLKIFTFNKATGVDPCYCRWEGYGICQKSASLIVYFRHAFFNNYFSKGAIVESIVINIQSFSAESDLVKLCLIKTLSDDPCDALRYCILRLSGLLDELVHDRSVF